MKAFCMKVVLGTLLFVPAAAFALVPGQWTGPYVGIQAGLNRTSVDGFSSANAFTVGIHVGYDAQLSEHFVVGGDVFYEWNQNKDHSTCISGAGCGSFNFGSNVYGVEGKIGFPLGLAGNFMPYVKLGYSHLDVTGDNVSGSDNALRYGVGVEWMLGESTGLTFQYMRGKYGDDVGNWKNNNFTVGVNFHF
ncbi:MAG: porin family protein [Gammaproteobacteria bacterium]